MILALAAWKPPATFWRSFLSGCAFHSARGRHAPHTALLAAIFVVRLPAVWKPPAPSTTQRRSHLRPQFHRRHGVDDAIHRGLGQQEVQAQASADARRQFVIPPGQLGPIVAVGSKDRSQRHGPAGIQHRTQRRPLLVIRSPRTTIAATAAGSSSVCVTSCCKSALRMPVIPCVGQSALAMGRGTFRCIAGNNFGDRGRQRGQAGAPAPAALRWLRWSLLLRGYFPQSSRSPLCFSS